MQESSETAAPRAQAPSSARVDGSGLVLITLRLEPGEPITGTLTTVGQKTGTPFCGWMELIATISTLRSGQHR